MRGTLARPTLTALLGLTLVCTTSAQGTRPAGTPTMGGGAGAPTGGRTAGTPTPGMTQAGNPFANPSIPSGNNTNLPSGNVSFPNTTTSNTFPGTASATPFNNGNTTGVFPSTGTFFPNGLGFTVGGSQVVAPGVWTVPPGVNGYDPSAYAYPGFNGYTGTEFNPNAGVPNAFSPNAFGTPPAAPMTATVPSNYAGVTAGNSATDNVVRLRLLARPDATIWVDSQRTTPTGLVRDFVSPPIDPNREYGYEIKAEWTEGGRTVTRQRRVTFFAGDRLTVNLLTDPNSAAGHVSVHQTLKTTPPDVPAAPAPQGYRSPPPRANFAVGVDESAHDGVVTSLTAMTLHVAGEDKRQHEYELTPGAQITCDNSACPLNTIQPGMRVRVTTKNNNLHAAIRVEAIDQNLRFVQSIR